MYASPDESAEADEALRQIGMMIGREKRVVQLLELADWLTDHPGSLDDAEIDHTKMPAMSEAITDIAMLVAPSPEAGEPVLATRGVLRVASRFWGEPVDRKNRLTDGRLAVARMVAGGSTARRAHLALIELANTLCRPVDPICLECPLGQHCRTSHAGEQRASALF
jgi:DNA (cytosine-5)-methyltransferase 1